MTSVGASVNDTSTPAYGLERREHSTTEPCSRLEEPRWHCVKCDGGKTAGPRSLRSAWAASALDGGDYFLSGFRNGTCKNSTCNWHSNLSGHRRSRTRCPELRGQSPRRRPRHVGYGGRRRIQNLRLWGGHQECQGSPEMETPAMETPETIPERRMPRGAKSSAPPRARADHLTAF